MRLPSTDCDNDVDFLTVIVDGMDIKGMWVQQDKYEMPQSQRNDEFIANEITGNNLTKL